MNGRDIPTPDQPPTFPPVGGRTLAQYLAIYEGAFTEVGLRAHWQELHGINAAGGAAAPGPVSITQAMLVKPSVGEPELFTGAVSTRVLADLAVTSEKIVSLAYAKLTGAPTGLPPVGTAGGHLTGTYPNPTIKAGVVGDPQISFVTGGKISMGTVTLDRLDPVVQARIPPAPALPTDYGRVLTVDPGTGLLIWLPPTTGGGGGGGDSLWMEDLGTQMLSPISANTGIAFPRSGGDGIVFLHTNYPTVDRRTGIGADDGRLLLHGGTSGIMFKTHDSTAIMGNLDMLGFTLPAEPTLPMHAATKQYVDAQGGGGVPEAPTDGQTYGRRNLAWSPMGTNLWLIEPTAPFVKLDTAITASNSGILLDDSGYFGYRFKHSTLDTLTWMTGISADENFLYVRGSTYGTYFQDSAGGDTLAHLQADGGFFPNYFLMAPTARTLAAGANHNVSPGGLSILSVSAPSFASITGIIAGYPGRLLLLYCTGAQAIDINIENALSTANNRIRGRADQTYAATDPTLWPGSYMLLRYVGNPTNRWEILTPQPVGKIMDGKHLRDYAVANLQLAPTCITADKINPAPLGADVGKVLTVGAGPALLWQTPVVGVTGTGVANQLARWSGTTALAGHADLTHDTTGKVLALAGTLAVAGTATAKTRLHAGGSFPTATFSVNRTLSNTQDDATKSSWFLNLDAQADQVQLNRCAPGDTSSQIIAFKVDNVGSPSFAGPNLVLSSSAIQMLISTAQAGPSAGFYLNNSYAPQDLSKGSLTMVMDAAVAPNPGLYFFYRFNGSAAGQGTQFAFLSSGGNLVLAGPTGQKSTGTTWSNPSDRRIKDEITDYPTGLDTVCQLQPRTFVYNGKGGSVAGMRGYGFVADEVAAVMPEMVGTHAAKLNAEDEELTDIQTVDQSNLILALVNGLKELAARVAALEAA